MDGTGTEMTIKKGEEEMEEGRKRGEGRAATREEENVDRGGWVVCGWWMREGEGRVDVRQYFFLSFFRERQT